MTSRIEWLGRAAGGEGVAERSFLLDRGSGAVPGVLWSPDTSARPPTVLLGHGGSGHKRCERHLRMGHWLASATGLAVVAIDGSYHGDRVQSPMDPADYQQVIVDEGIQSVTARMTEDWLETVTGSNTAGADGEETFVRRCPSRNDWHQGHVTASAGGHGRW